MNLPGSRDADPRKKAIAGGAAVGNGAQVVNSKSRPAVLAATPNPIGLLLALRRRWLLALSLAVIGGMAVAGAVWTFTKTTWTARTTLLVHSRPPIILSELIDSRTDFVNYQRTQIALVKSRLVLMKALQNSKVAKWPLLQEKADPLVWLEKEIRVDFSVAPEILRISMVGDDPESLTAMVDAVRYFYLEDIVYKEERKQTIRLTKLKDLYNDYDTKLRDKRRVYAEMAETVGSKDAKVLDLIHEFTIKQLHSYQNDLLRVQSELLKEKLELSMEDTKQEVAPSTTIPQELLEDYLRNEPQLAPLIKSLSSLEDNIRRIEKTAVDPAEEPGYNTMKKNVEIRKQEIESLRQTLRPQVSAKLLDQLKVQVRNNADGHKKRVELLTKLEDALKMEIKGRGQALDQFQKNRVNIEWMRDEIALADDVAKKLAIQMNAMEIESRAPGRISTLEEGVAVKDTDGSIKMSALAGTGVFALIVFCIALLEFLKRRINSVDEVVRGLEIPLMGTLPAIPQGAHRKFGASNHPRDVHWQHLLTESVDAARTMLLHLARQELRQVVMVTSAAGGEGKTLLSCHLAASLARSGLRTLLVDCDLRRPAVHKVFSLAAEPGFGELLRGERQTTEVVQPGPVDGLWVMPAGNSDSVTLQLLARKGAKDIFKRLKEQFDFILVDSAPILPVVDSLLIASSVDAVMFSILRDVSRLPTVYAAYERLAALGVPFLGAVVNGTPSINYGTRYAYHAATAGSQLPVEE